MKYGIGIQSCKFSIQNIAIVRRVCNFCLTLAKLKIISKRIIKTSQRKGGRN